MGKTEHKSISSWELAKRNAAPRAIITAYDYPFARLAAEAGIDGTLVGNSLGMTVRGERDTLCVSLDEIIYHTEMVVRGAPECLIMADMPFGSFEKNPRQAFAGAAKLLKARADVVKIEGGAAMAETVEFLSARTVPVCAHIGLTPQHIRQLGGFRKQGKTEEEASRLVADAIAFVQAGARFVLIEAVPNELGAMNRGRLNRGAAALVCLVSLRWSSHPPRLPLTPPAVPATLHFLMLSHHGPKAQKCIMPGTP